MKKIFIILVFSFSLFSCNRKVINFELLNQEIICKKIHEDSLDYYHINRKFKNDKELYKFTNQVVFKVLNNTDNKYLFYTKSLKLHDIYNIDIIIEDESNNLLEKRVPLIDGSFNCKIQALNDNNENNLSVTKKLLEKNGYNIKLSDFGSYSYQDVIIYPKNEYIFSSTISLPFVVEDTDLNLRRPIYFKFDTSKKYTFRLKYKLKENIEKILSNEMLKNLKNNDVEIFKDIIETQKIPIKFVN